MDDLRVDYDRLAPTYEDRYKVGPLQGISDALVSLVRQLKPHRVLEVGCGTGHWLRELAPHAAPIYGVDASLGMLRAAERGSADLVAGVANSPPYRNRAFDLIYCVNALHHFGDPHAFIDHAPEFLRRPGTLSISGIDPRVIRQWYFYDYFAGTYERDLRRFPSIGDIVNWMGAAGMERIESRVVETTVAVHRGRSVFSDPFLRKNSNSQLALLTDAEYAAGLQRIENAISQAEKEDREIQFPAELPFIMITGVGRSGRGIT